MADYPYTRGREWVNQEDGAQPPDPAADADWFMNTEEAIHGLIDDVANVGGGGGGTTVNDIWMLRSINTFSLGGGDQSWTVIRVNSNDTPADVAFNNGAWVAPVDGYYNVSFMLKPQITGADGAGDTYFSLEVGGAEGSGFSISEDLGTVAGPKQIKAIYTHVSDGEDHVLRIQESLMLGIEEGQHLYLATYALEDILVTGGNAPPDIRIDIQLVATPPVDLG